MLLSPTPRCGSRPNAFSRNSSRFHSFDATAESTTLPDASIDLILAAQAFHWFDPPKARAEFLRILRPGGYVVLVWNDRRQDSTPFLRDYERLLQTFGTDCKQVRHENITDSTIAAFFAPSSYEIRTFPNAQELDYLGLEARLLSSSYTPAADHPARGPMLAELRKIFDQRQSDGRVVFEYDTRAYFSRLA
jgi:SAM-dependent methyltransferase